MNSFFKQIVLSVAFFCSTITLAQAPSGYYNTAVGKAEAELKTALYNIIKNHDVLEYYSSSASFRQTDWHPDGYFWDMYSNYKRTSWTGMNREHNMPKSWWSDVPETTVAYSDLHNLYPSDAEANSAKSNYPLGIVTGTPTYTNGVVKVGKNSYPGYTGTVFEPANEYKGDFARDYMYVVTCYENYAANWRSTGTASMLFNGGTYPVFRPYAVNLLLEWSRNDPVSSKEINRNNAVYLLQGNRNPFVDYPILAELIWGKYKGQAWAGDNATPETEADFYVSYNDLDKKLFVKVNKPETATYFIYSVSGVVVLSDNIISADAKIDVSGLEKGMYIVKIYSGIRRKTDKFIVG